MTLPDLLPGILLGGGALFAAYIPIPWLVNRLSRRRFLARTGRDGHVWLTFDDGPDARVTPLLLDLLDRHGVRAAFFVTGENVERHRHLVARMIEGGHIVGSHGYAHRHPWRTGPVRTALDLARGDAALAPLRAGGPWFRPPYGKYNLVTLLYVALRRKRVVFWDLDPGDYRRSDGASLARDVLDGMRPGSVVLLHDGRRRGQSDGRVTAEAVERILDEGMRRGIAFPHSGSSENDETVIGFQKRNIPEAPDGPATFARNRAGGIINQYIQRAIMNPRTGDDRCWRWHVI